MGGMGSGRRYQGGKGTTSDMRVLDVRRLQRDGLLIPGCSFRWQWTRSGEEVASIQIRTEVDRVMLNYQSRSNGGVWQAMEYPVRLEWTGCNLGGQRAWLICPEQGCGRRVAILYAGSVFACRHCHKLAYQCQRETVGNRAMRTADTIRERLGWQLGIANPPGNKPRGMHWRTYLRLMTKYQGLAHVSWTETARRMGLLNQMIDEMGLDCP